MESKGKNKRRRATFPPPSRLSWGGGSNVVEQVKNIQDTTIWVDKYTPQSIDDLCVAPKKVQEVLSWMETRSPSQKLLILVGSPGIGKSTMVRLLAKHNDSTLHEWSDSYSSNDFSCGPLSMEQISPLKSFEEFMHRCGAGFTPMAQSERFTSINKSIILLDELPNLYNSEAEENFRMLMNMHFESSNVPAIMIFSDVFEGQHKPGDLERLINPNYLYSNYVEIVRVHSVTKAKIKKVCSAICKKEKLPFPEWEEFNLHCGGDIRHAIMTLQFRGKETMTVTLENRDQKLSTFHTLGKILYAKRQKGSYENGERPPLVSDPEKVMEESDMGLGGALTFLGYHSPSFFTDITELSQTFGNFSDAASLLDLTIDAPTRQADILFPNAYVGSLAGRAIANANKHPAPLTFRALSAPKVFEAYRKARANGSTMLHLCKRLSVGSNMLLLDTNVGASRTFITDYLPFMRTILPNEINLALGNMYSFVGANEPSSRSTEEELDLKNTAEQAAIFAEDDLVDDEDAIDEISIREVPSIKVTQSEGEDVMQSTVVETPKEIIVIDD